MKFEIRILRPWSGHQIWIVVVLVCALCVDVSGAGERDEKMADWMCLYFEGYRLYSWGKIWAQFRGWIIIHSALSIVCALYLRKIISDSTLHIIIIVYLISGWLELFSLYRFLNSLSNHSHVGEKDILRGIIGSMSLLRLILYSLARLKTVMFFKPSGWFKMATPFLIKNVIILRWW